MYSKYYHVPYVFGNFTILLLNFISQFFLIFVSKQKLHFSTIAIKNVHKEFLDHPEKKDQAVDENTTDQIRIGVTGWLSGQSVGLEIQRSRV